MESKYASFSPYVYALNDPLNVIDSDGREPDPIILYRLYQALLNGPELLAANDFKLLYETAYRTTGTRTTQGTFAKSLEGLVGDYYRYRDNIWDRTVGGNHIDFASEVHLSGMTFVAYFSHFRRKYISDTEINNVDFLRGEEGDEPFKGVAGRNGYYVALNDGNSTVVYVDVGNPDILNKLEKDYRDKYRKTLDALIAKDEIVSRKLALDKEHKYLNDVMYPKVYVQVNITKGSDIEMPKTKIVTNHELKKEYDKRLKIYLKKEKQFRKDQKEAIKKLKERINNEKYQRKLEADAKRKKG